MSLAMVATGYHKVVRMGYLHFTLMRQGIAYAYSEKHGRLYERATSFKEKLNFDEIVEQWNDGCNDDLDLLLFNSDCSGSFTYQECKRILKVLNTLTVQYEDEKMQKLYDEFVLILKHCSKRRVKLIFC